MCGGDDVAATEQPPGSGHDALPWGSRLAVATTKKWEFARIDMLAAVAVGAGGRWSPSESVGSKGCLSSVGC